MQAQTPVRGVGLIAVVLPVIATGISIWMRLALGPSLGFYFSGLFLALVLAPAAALSARSARGTLALQLLSIAPIAIVWLITVNDPSSQIAECAAVLMSTALALGFFARLLRQVLESDALAQAIATVVGLAFLTWPVWLSAELAQAGQHGMINGLVAISPALCINGILTHQPAWTEQSIAYQLTVLNQDVAISFPRHAWICAAFFALIAIVAGFAAEVRSCFTKCQPLREEPA